MPHVLITWTSLRHVAQHRGGEGRRGRNVTCCDVTYRSVREGCPGGEDKGFAPLLKGKIDEFGKVNK